MSKTTELFEYMRQCPQLADLWSIGARDDVDITVIYPQGASQVYQYAESISTTGLYMCDMIPYPSVWEDYQINCYKVYSEADDSAPGTNINVIGFDDVQAICDWVTAKNNAGELPSLTGYDVISIECVPHMPQIRYVNEAEDVIAYYITVRIRYKNKAARKYIEA